LLCLLLARSSHAAPCRSDCSDLPCHIESARCLLRQGSHRQVKNRLRPLLAEHPESTELSLLLARAYLGLGNKVWARRVLYQAMQSGQQSCLLRSWLIWIHLDMAELDQAASLLKQGKGSGRVGGADKCPDEAMQGRWHLLGATLARLRKDPGRAGAQLTLARREPSLLPEDMDLMAWLEAYAEPGRPMPLDLRAEVGVGYTSNGLMSSPADLPSASTSSQTGSGSPALTLDLLARFQPPWGGSLRPLVEGGLRGLVLFDDDVRDYSYYSFSIRPGVALWDTLELSYHGQLFLLAGGDRYDLDGPRAFYEAHRAEASWAAAPWLNLWGGVGRSVFREQVRTRVEADGGVGLAGRLWRLRLLGGLSFRTHWADHQAYDLWGGTLLGSATLPVWRLSLRARLVLGFDLHSTSVGYFEQDVDRRDLLIKGGAEAWSPAWRGLRAGLSYDLSNRTSTATVYEYTDHRVLVRLRFHLGLDPWAPRRRDAPPGHVALPYGVSSAEGGLEEERIQDLLRQEDAAQRGSSCVN